MLHPIFVVLLLWAAPIDHGPAEPVSATVRSSLRSDGSHIRQLAFDGAPGTYFASAQNASKTDSFTLNFSRPVAVKTITVTTGRPDGKDQLDTGRLEVSSDGRQFENAASFAHGSARAQPHGRLLRALRIRPTADLKHPLVIREIAVVSDPTVAVFKYPVEVEVDTSDAPEMSAWAARAAEVCEQAYPMICAELSSPGFKPPQVIHMKLSKRYRGVAATGGTHVIASVRYFQSHPEDVGALVHETAHVVQHYRGRRNPSWLVEGVADYVRFFKYEPGHLGRIRARTARYNGSYRVTAAFLEYLTTKYDKHIVRKLNQAMREGTYRESLFRDLTGKTVQQLGDEWKKTLGR